MWEWEKRRGYWRSLNTSDVAVLEDAYQVYLKERDSSVDGQSDVENAGEFTATIVLQNEEWQVSTIPYDNVHIIQCIEAVCLKCVLCCVWCVWCVVLS